MRSPSRTVVQHRVRYHEADAQGFLFNSRYLELADVAMTEFFRAIGFPYPQLLAQGADPSVVKAGIEFRRPARFEDLLDVAVTCTRVGRGSFDLAMAVTREGVEIAEITLTYVNVDVVKATSRPLPEPVAAALLDELRNLSGPRVGDPPIVRPDPRERTSGSGGDDGASSG